VERKDYGEIEIRIFGPDGNDFHGSLSKDNAKTLALELLQNV